jgi:hypothetical protein
MPGATLPPSAPASQRQTTRAAIHPRAPWSKLRLYVMRTNAVESAHFLFPLPRTSEQTIFSPETGEAGSPSLADTIMSPTATLPFGLLRSANLPHIPSAQMQILFASDGHETAKSTEAKKSTL